MASVIKIIGVLVILAVSSKIVMKVLESQQAAREKQEIADLVRATNTGLPKEVAPGLSMTKLEIGAGVFRAYYKILPDANFDPDRIGKYDENAIAQACSGPLRELSKRGFTIDFRFNYQIDGSDKNFSLAVPPSKCGFNT